MLSFFPKRERREFNYVPRYYDPQKEAWEKKKAARGLDSELSEEEKLRIRLRTKWGRDVDSGDVKNKSLGFSKIRTLCIVAFCIFAVYVVFFTPLVENCVEMFLKIGGR